MTEITIYTLLIKLYQTESLYTIKVCSVDETEEDYIFRVPVPCPYDIILLPKHTVEFIKVEHKEIKEWLK